MSVNLSPVAGAAAQFLDNSGNVLTGGKLYTYLAGTTTPAATYTSSAGATFHSNPIILDAAGRVPNGGEIWLSDNIQYKFVLKDANEVLIGTWDNLIGINSNFINYNTQEEIQVATAGQTVFTLATVTYQPGTNTLSVFVDGVNQYDGISYAYVETDSTTVTFTAGLHVGALVKFTTAVTLSAGVTDSSLVVYDPPYTASVPTTVELKLAQTVSVKDFGAVGDGVTDDTAAIQSAIDALDSGIVNIPPGNYLINSDVTLLLKGGDSLNERFAIQGTGAKFTGTGNIIIDSCKRLELTGFEMPTQNIEWRGCWWSQFNNLMFKQLVTSNVLGTSFTSAFWNQFNNCLLQNVYVGTAATLNAVNELTFNSCNIRGDAAHGFTSTFNYAFEFIGDRNCQSWKMYGGDVSYQNIATYYIDPANINGDVELTFNGVYFDTLYPLPISREATKIETISCHHANIAGIGETVAAMVATPFDYFRNGRSYTSDASANYNMIYNGDFSQITFGWTGTYAPITSSNGSTITAQNGGISGTYLNINQPLTTANTITFKTKILPFNGRMTAGIVLRNANAGSKTIRLGILNQFINTTITDTDWTITTLTSTEEMIAGSVATLDVLTVDTTDFNIDVAGVWISYGDSAGFMLPSKDYRTITYQETYDAPSIPAGDTVIQSFTVSGATLGDFAVASFSGSIGSLDIQAAVIATDTVRLKLTNDGSSPIDLGSGTWRFRIFKKDFS